MIIFEVLPLTVRLFSVLYLHLHSVFDQAGHRRYSCSRHRTSTTTKIPATRLRLGPECNLLLEYYWPEDYGLDWQKGDLGYAEQLNGLYRMPEIRLSQNPIPIRQH